MPDSAALRRLREAEATFPDIRVELIDGDVVPGGAVPSAHGQMVAVIGAQLVPAWCVMTGVDTVYEGWRGSTLVKPDISVADPSYRGTRLKQFPADEILLAVEVVSESNPENDLDKKVRKYAQAGIPRYLIVNPLDGTCLLYSTPGLEGYRDSLRRDFGEPVPIGDPIGTELDSSALYRY